MVLESRLGRLLPVGILAAGAAGALLLATSRPPLAARAPEPTRPLTAVHSVRLESVDVSVSSFGSVEPRSEVALVAEIAGRVASLSPDLVAGGAFAAGDPLVVLDAVDAQVALDRREAQLARAEIEERQMLARLERSRALADGSVASRAQREDAEFSLELAGARVREARADRNAARRGLEHTVLAAPFAGRVRSERVAVGQFVERGESLAQLFARDGLEVRLPLADRQLAVLELPEPGTTAAATGERNISGIPARLSAAYAGRQRSWPARVVRSEAEISTESRVFYAVAQLSDSDGAPPPPIGLFVEAEIRGVRFDGVAVLPRSALHGDDTVLVVDAEGRVRERSVEVARIEADRVLVASGLLEGERVCIGSPAPAAGSLVRTLAAGAKS